MPTKDDLIEWSPHFAPHVKGRYEPRTYNREAGMHNPQAIYMHCTFEGCGTKWNTVCSTGQVRGQIARFAARHLHRDPFEKP